ncbi:MAG: hypothetical protein MJE77_35720 [Proteobacteria bacterium]|nr:hypothetical protein [Pseudomonadota bacterium]
MSRQGMRGGGLIERSGRAERKTSPLFVGVIALCAALTAGCESKQLSISSGQTGQSYGRAELIAALARFSDSDRSPARYRQMALEIAKLRPRFDEDVANEADRHLIFTASTLLDARFERPHDEQFRDLALTVWPTVLEVEPRAGEDATSFTRRACAAELAGECKRVVAEYRPLMLSALVWRTVEERAHEAINACATCRVQAEYGEALSRIDRRERAIAMAAGQAEDRAHPRSWPSAGQNAQPWTGSLLLVIDSEGVATIAGDEIAANQLRGELHKRRAETDSAQLAVLGVYLPPSAPVRMLRTALADAASAGYREVAIQVRAPQYPYPLREYRLTTARRRASAKVRVRDADSVQVLIQALDAAAGRAGDLPLRI